VLCTAVLIVAVVATATSVMHDANLGALIRSARFNRVLGYSADLLGASSWLWRFEHNHLHHGNTKVVGVDSVISQAPLVQPSPCGTVWTTALFATTSRRSRRKPDNQADPQNPTPSARRR
jgi:fatty acid desaturase